MQPSKEIAKLVEIMAALRTPKTGCPWDLEQDFASIAPYTIEEAYEVADAIERQDWEDLCDELGDLLLQPIYHARMAQEAGLFDFGDVIEGITAKMIRRHPHVFGTQEQRANGMTKGAWERIKTIEKDEKTARRKSAGSPTQKPKGYLDDVPTTLPALQSAVKLQKQAARIGFDWDDIAPVMDKIREELDEVSRAMEIGDKQDIESEIGDLLFSITNLARHLDIEPDNALRKSNQKFKRRFGYIEQTLIDSGSTLKQATLDEMDGLWNEAKAGEKT